MISLLYYYLFIISIKLYSFEKTYQKIIWLKNWFLELFI